LRRGQDDWTTLLASLGALYARGAAVDWPAFDRGHARRKVALPAYPFQRQRFWLTSPPTHREAAFVQDARHSERTSPLPGRRLSSPLKQALFEARFSREALPWLGDHLVHGRVVVAGACHLSLLLAAAAESFGDGACALGDVVFPQALIL